MMVGASTVFRAMHSDRSITLFECVQHVIGRDSDREEFIATIKDRNPHTILEQDYELSSDESTLAGDIAEHLNSKECSPKVNHNGGTASSRLDQYIRKAFPRVVTTEKPKRYNIVLKEGQL